MDDPELPAALRTLQPAALQALRHPHAQSSQILASQLAPELRALSSSDPFQRQVQAELASASTIRGHSQHHIHPRQIFESAQPHHFHPSQALRQAHALPNHTHGARHFGIFTTDSSPENQRASPQNAVERTQQEESLFPSPENTDKRSQGHFDSLKIVPNPPNLGVWRQKLFDVDDTITLTEEDFQIYFPHIDNVYSHRSTQRYKRKPFVSHYWDCRMKGRPPGTPKSDDPNKKKRKRTARPRDLCDVKIKITEFFQDALPIPNFSQPLPSHQLDADNSGDFYASDHAGNQQSQVPFGMLSPTPQSRLPSQLPLRGTRYYTIQRVNGNGGNGKGDGIAGPHKHTLEESDRIKKNSVMRHILKEEREIKKVQTLPMIILPFVRGFRLSANPSFVTTFSHHSSPKSIPNPLKAIQTPSLVELSYRTLATMADKKDSEQKTYHKKATGDALNTVKKRSKEHDLKLFGGCFCPFVQRVWISLELKGIQYQYIEVDPYKKPQSLLEVNPRGLVPALRHGDWGCYESTVLMEYLEDLSTDHALLPPNDPQRRAYSRLWSDHINRHIIPGFYRVLQAQEMEKQIEHAGNLKTEISKLVEASDPEGPFFLGPAISFVDVQFAPWILRLRLVLKPYRGWPDPEEGSRWSKWVKAIEAHEAVKATTSTDQLYIDSYERYAENRPNTSQVANAINAGGGLP
ncbi:hypothetical protein L228DRAFT_264793 [Xylona heveae TC161]|uniref:Glutathione transferase n=1 Tax=Xylona heveae (strain CBS 132557 / TC161) TaxID=1328760 RepID=A0A165JLK7_XYLHT|nr:hypothetical protein L228DRAFT_264793 [Xylona heveae TC161]KZF26392.1 hypothetical protein L228DRAFT_264793 [Xylona heveae TC161]